MARKDASLWVIAFCGAGAIAVTCAGLSAFLLCTSIGRTLEADGGGDHYGSIGNYRI
jgi:hypothetical protein